MIPRNTNVAKWSFVNNHVHKLNDRNKIEESPEYNITPDNRILRDVIGMSWHSMSSIDIFVGRKRRQNSMEMPWHFDGIQQDFYEKKATP